VARGREWADERRDSREEEDRARGREEERRITDTVAAVVSM
jgi:hypothetical protein